MGNEGHNWVGTSKDGTFRHYESLESLKKYVNSNKSPSTPANQARLYDKDKIYEINVHLTQTSTGTQAELETTDSIAIAQISGSEIAVKLGASGDEATHNGKTFTLVYKNRAGTETTVIATGTATLATTQVAFSTDVTDFYEPVSFTSSATFSTESVYVEVTGGTTTYATIAAGQTASRDGTANELIGVGTIWCRSHTNHNDADAAKVYVSYFNYNGDYVKNAYGVIDSTDGTTEIQVKKVDTVTYTNGTVATATTTVKDCWYIVDLWTDTTPTANSHEFLLTDRALANVDGSGGDLYGVIKESEYISTFTRLRVPSGFDGWVGEFELQSPAVTATGDDIKFIKYFFPDGESIRRVYSHNFRNEYEGSHPFKLEEGQDMYITMADVGNPMECSYEAVYILAKRNTIT